MKHTGWLLLESWSLGLSNLVLRASGETQSATCHASGQQPCTCIRISRGLRECRSDCRRHESSHHAACDDGMIERARAARGFVRFPKQKLHLVRSIGPWSMAHGPCYMLHCLVVRPIAPRPMAHVPRPRGPILLSAISDNGAFYFSSSLHLVSSASRGRGKSFSLSAVLGQ